MSNEVSAPTEICPAGGAFCNSSFFIRPLLLDNPKHYAVPSFQGFMSCVFSYQDTYFERKLWQYRLLPSHRFARVGYKISKLRKIRQKHTSRTVNASHLETEKNPNKRQNKTKESIRKVYLLSIVGVFSQWN